jgi:hypothetical protein
MRRAGRILVLAFAALAACTPDRPGEPLEDEALVQTARDVVAMLGGYNCALLPGYLTSAGEEFLRQNIAPELMDTMSDPIERVCFVLGVVQKYPRSETMEVRAQALTAERADLLLLGGGRRAEMRLLREGGAWKLDHEWALKQVQDLAVHQALRFFAINEDEFYYYGGRRFTDNPQELTNGTHTAASFVQGVATPEVTPMAVFAALGPNAQSVCGSSLSWSGEVFMIRAAGDGSASYARGPGVPSSCPGTALARSW